jgi:hypothetical protein
MAQPTPIRQCGHHVFSGFSRLGTRMTLQQSVQPSQARTVANPARVVEAPFSASISRPMVVAVW